MIEIQLEKRGSAWDVNATILPKGGLGIAKDARLASIGTASFAEAAHAVANLTSATFQENPDRWGVPEPKFQIINQSSHSDHENFGNYKVVRSGRIIGQIKNFPKGEVIDLIKAALHIVAGAENKS